MALRINIKKIIQKKYGKCKAQKRGNNKFAYKKILFYKKARHFA